MYCTQCGDELREIDRFCSQCGQITDKGRSQPHGTTFAERRLVRPMHQKTLGGVCAGFANYLEVDVTLMRIIWLSTAIFFGLPFIAYLVCWIVMPSDWGPAGQPAKSSAPQSSEAPQGSSA